MQIADSKISHMKIKILQISVQQQLINNFDKKKQVQTKLRVGDYSYREKSSTI